MADSLLSVSVLGDALSKKKDNLVFLPSTLTLANVQTYLTAFAPLLDAITDGQIVGASIAFGLTLPGGLKSGPVADSDARMAWRASFGNASRFKWGNYVPAIAASKRAGGIVDPTDTDISAYLNAMITGLSTFQPTNGYGDDLTSFARGKISLLK